MSGCVKIYAYIRFNAIHQKAFASEYEQSTKQTN